MHRERVKHPSCIRLHIVLHTQEKTNSKTNLKKTSNLQRDKSSTYEEILLKCTKTFYEIQKGTGGSERPRMTKCAIGRVPITWKKFGMIY